MSPFIQSPLGVSASSLPCWQSTFFLSRTGLCNGRLSCGSPRLVVLGIFGALKKLKSAANDLPYTSSQVALGLFGQYNAQASKITHCQCCESSNEVYSLKGGHRLCLGYKFLSLFRSLLQTFLLIFFFFFFFRIVSNFNMMKTLTLLVHAGLFCCFHSPLNSVMDYRVFNVHMWSFCMHIYTHNGPQFIVSFKGLL